jgi:hypothetical protein
MADKVSPADMDWKSVKVWYWDEDAFLWVKGAQPLSLADLADTETPVNFNASFNTSTGVTNVDNPAFYQIFQLLSDLRTELRIQNALLLSGLNVKEDLDTMRKDGYYSDAAVV